MNDCACRDHILNNLLNYLCDLFYIYIVSEENLKVIVAQTIVILLKHLSLNLIPTTLELIPRVKFFRKPSN